MTTALRGELTCRELVELVTDYLDDAMTPLERARFEEHIHYCPQCSEYFAQIQSTVRLTGKLTEASLPEPAKDALLGAFRQWKRSAT